MFFKSTPIEEIVGHSIAQVLPRLEKPWYLVPHLLQLNLVLIVPLLSSATAGYDGSLMNGLQAIDEWKDTFSHPKGTMLGFVNAAQNFGCVVALPFCGWLTDYIGRKWTLFIGLCGVIIATVIQASGDTLAQLIVSRFVVGGAGMLAVQPAPLLVAELSYPSYRGKMTSLYWCLYYLGAILASWTCYGSAGRGDTWAWRIPTILQGAFPVVQLCFLPFLPESPRWLISKGKVDKARDIMLKYHAGGADESPLVDMELSEVLAALDMERQAKQTKWLDLISTPGNRKRTYIALSLGIFAQWNGVAVVSYYLTLVLDTIGITSSSMQTLINGLLQLFNLFCAASAALMVDFLGRRTLFLWSGVGMLISYVIWTACLAVFDQTGSMAAGRAVVGFIFIFYFHYDIAYTPLLMAYPTEIFPYSLRSKGVTVELLGVYGSLVIASFCNSITLDNIGWRYYIVFCVLLVVIVLNTYLFYPETKGYSLEEMARLFDDERVDLELVGHYDKKPEVEHIETVSDRD